MNITKAVAGSLLDGGGATVTTKAVAGTLLDGRTWMVATKVVVGTLIQEPMVTTVDIPLVIVGATISAAHGGPASGGPFIYEPAVGLALTSTQASTSTDIAAKQSLRILPVTSVVTFPVEPGWIAVGIGQDYQTGPIRYLGKTAGGILIDPSYRFENAIPAGATVILLAGRDTWQPDFNEYDDEFTLTNSGVGLDAAEAAIDSATAAGVDIEKHVVYPPDHGLGGSGAATEGEGKLSDVVRVFGSDDVQVAVEKARNR